MWWWQWILMLAPLLLPICGIVACVIGDRNDKKFATNHTADYKRRQTIRAFFEAIPETALETYGWWMEQYRLANEDLPYPVQEIYDSRVAGLRVAEAKAKDLQRRLEEKKTRNYSEVT